MSLAAIVAGGLAIDVAVTSRFEGRLWMRPARIYSAALSIGTGDRLSIEELGERLRRAGYARTEDAPARAGQYRTRPDEMQVFARPFDAGAVRIGARLVRVHFARDRVRQVVSDDGADRLRLEPELLATLYGRRQEDRVVVPLERVPRSMRLAVVAAEDARFAQHAGLDLRAIARAALANAFRREIVQGGSTITQQTVKNLYLDQRRTWWRKLREAPMALVLDARFSKDRILEVYLNEVYFGQRGSVAICGIQAAARFYFGRDVSDLSLAEQALLAGLIRSPGHYNPFVHAARARARRDHVLDAMGRLGFATAESIDAARGEPIRLASGGGGFDGAAYAVDFIRAELARSLSARQLREDGLVVYTTIDTRAQRHAEEALAEGLARLDREVETVRRQVSERTLQAAVIVTEPDSGAILAMVGGRDYRRSQFNRAAQARRQPGSCFKPFVYAAGFERARDDPAHGLTPATLLDDTPLEVRTGGHTWRPVNYDRRHRGPVTARRAIEESLNVPTVRAAQTIGLGAVIDVARRAGISSPIRRLPSVALGSAEVTPLELSTAYGTIARRGRKVDPWVIQAVYDESGRLVERHRAGETAGVISPEAAFLVHETLTGVVERGTARSATRHGLAGGAAGKTGTTDDTRDAWFVGYDAERLALVWVGYDDNGRTGLTGATGALPIWADLMGRLGPPADAGPAPPPPGVVRVEVDPETGLRARPRCPARFGEWFLAGTEPEEGCPRHVHPLKRWFTT